MKLLVALLLGLAVLSSWLAAWGLLRLRTPLDRLHLPGFLGLATGIPLLLAALLTDGATNRLLKIALLLAVTLAAGAGTSHALGQALVRRRPPEAEHEDA